MIDIIVLTVVLFLWLHKSSAKKKLVASVILIGYCIYAGLFAHANGSTGLAVFFIVVGMFNVIAAHRWLGIAYPDKRLTDGKDDSV